MPNLRKVWTVSDSLLPKMSDTLWRTLKGLTILNRNTFLEVRVAAVPGHASKHGVITAPEQLSLEQYQSQSACQAFGAFAHTYADKNLCPSRDRKPEAAFLAGSICKVNACLLTA